VAQKHEFGVEFTQEEQWEFSNWYESLRCQPREFSRQIPISALMLNLICDGDAAKFNTLTSLIEFAWKSGKDHGARK
jgi:hypothetical protein